MTPEERKKLNENLDKSLEQSGLLLMIILPLVFFLMVVLR